MKPFIPCLMGPTASGKTTLAIELAQLGAHEIISVDSALVYRGMDIGTAKPSAALQRSVPHHLIDIREPNDPYSAADFRRDALACIDSCLARGVVPLLVGGTMLYYKALQQGIAELPAACPEVRAELARRVQTEGLAKLHEELTQVDLTAAERIHPNDTQRLLRALEVYHQTGESLSAWLAREQTIPLPFTCVNLVVTPPSRVILRERIVTRFQTMLDEGLVDEVRALRARGDLHSDYPSMRSVGYRQAWQYLEQEIDFKTMREKAITATCQLAKRQQTWLRSWPESQLIDVKTSPEEIRKLIPASL